MAKINLVLADSDELYLNKLTDYFMGKGSRFDVRSFTSQESLARHVSDAGNKTDIILFGEGLSQDAVRSSDIPVKICLADGAFGSLPGFESVNKYQKAEALFRAVLAIYAEKTGNSEVFQGDKQTKVVGVWSPVGGSGKTTMALALSMSLAGQGRRAFYLNYEIIGSTAELLSSAPGGSLSDVFLSLKTKGSNVGLRVVANKRADEATKINYINPPESALEINELTIAEQLRLIQELDALGEFDAVIVDFDSGFPASKLDLLDACDVILMPFTADAISLGKIKLLMEECRMRAELEPLFQKIRLALNKADARASGNLRQSGILSVKPVEVTLQLSPTLADINNLPYAAESLHGVFADFASSLLG